MSRSRNSLPEVFAKRLEQQFGAASAKRIMAAFATKRLPTFRTNTLKATDEEIMEGLRCGQVQFERIKTIPHAFRVRNRTEAELFTLPIFTEGKAYMQGVASMLPVLALQPKPGEQVLDLCAAPGSKTSQMAAMMQNTGTIVACEENSVRFQKLEHTLRLLGVKNVDARCMDAAFIAKEFPLAFDKVLADVPCSAEGRMYLKDPRTYRFWSEKNIVAHAKLQRRLLRSAVGALKPGGVLIYSTCTLAPEEDELMVAWVLGEFPEMKLQKPVEYVLPTEEHEGFFMGCLEKVRG